MSDVLKPVPEDFTRSTTRPEPKGPPEWAVYIYMKPDQALEKFAEEDIQEMAAGLKGDTVPVVVHLEQQRDVQRLLVADGEARPVQADRKGKAYPTRIPEAAGSLEDFLAWAGTDLQEPPAARRAVGALEGRRHGSRRAIGDSNRRAVRTSAGELAGPDERAGAGRHSARHPARSRHEVVGPGASGGGVRTRHRRPWPGFLLHEQRGVCARVADAGRLSRRR